MDGILSWIIFAGLFFFMMRFGCGSHKSDKNKTTNNQQQHIDPVCGKTVNLTQGYGKMHEQALYRFCSRECLDKFEADHKKYSLSNK